MRRRRRRRRRWMRSTGRGNDDRGKTRGKRKKL